MYQLKVFMILVVTIVESHSEEKIECKTEDDRQCKIPFSFGGKTFDSCMLWHKNGEKATVCLPKLKQTIKSYSTGSDLKYCSKECPIERTVCDECIFPFLYNGKTHNTCLKWHKGANSYPTWCATALDLNNEFKNGDRHWGHCSDDCRYNVQKVKPQMPAVCKECIFPFRYKGQTYFSCINKGINPTKLGKQNLTWCPIAVDENNEFKDGDRHFEYCTPDCNSSGNTGVTIGLSFFAVIVISAFLLILIWHRKKFMIIRNVETGQFEFLKM